MKKSKFSGIIIILAIVMAVSVFLPFMSATGNTAKAIDRYPNQKLIQGLDYTLKDMESPSLVEMIKMNQDFYSKNKNQENNFMKVIIYTVCMVAASIVAAVFASKTDAKKVIIFVAIAIAFMLMIIGDAGESAIFDPDHYNYGMGVWVFLASSIAAIVCAVKMKKEVAKSKNSGAQAAQY